MELDFRQLGYALVSQETSFTRAAAQLTMSRPTASNGSTALTRGRQVHRSPMLAAAEFSEIQIGRACKVCIIGLAVSECSGLHSSRRSQSALTKTREQSRALASRATILIRACVRNSSAWLCQARQRRRIDRCHYPKVNVFPHPFSAKQRPRAISGAKAATACCRVRTTEKDYCPTLSTREGR
jgi:hypothetical protein